MGLDIARWRLLIRRVARLYAVSVGEAVGSLLTVRAEILGQAA